jgi:uncharacterized membrane protein
LEAIDCLRGVVMVLMALDHARGFFVCTLLDPTDLSRTNVALFLTRWITHFCAPVFCFLAGTGVFLSMARGKPRPALARYLVSRGVWLVFLELTIVQFCWRFGWDSQTIRCQVLWAIGCSMIVLGAVLFLPPWAVLVCGVAVLVVNDQLGEVLANHPALGSSIGILLVSGGTLPLTPDIQLTVTYPVLPWFGVMAAGFGLGPLWQLERGERRRWLLILGTLMILLFVILRYTINMQGKHAWTTQSSELLTLLSFLNCRKYPPSLPYVLMTLGPALVGLALLDRESSARQSCLLTFGREPLLFYVLHLPLLHVLARGTVYVWHHGPAFSSLAGYSKLVDGSVSWLLLVYCSWMAALLLLYPFCRWLLTIRQRREIPFMRYF